jgi:hypothetical protein
MMMSRATGRGRFKPMFGAAVLGGGQQIPHTTREGRRRAKGQGPRAKD